LNIKRPFVNNPSNVVLLSGGEERGHDQNGKKNT